MMDRDALKIYASLLRLISIPFNIISIFNSLSIIDIGIYGLYSLLVGIVTFIVGSYIHWSLK